MHVDDAGCDDLQCPEGQVLCVEGCRDITANPFACGACQTGRSFIASKGTTALSFRWASTVGVARSFPAAVSIRRSNGPGAAGIWRTAKKAGR